MGRPAGVRNGEGTTVLTPIRKWGRKHEEVVHLHIATWPNEAIAERMGCSKTRVSQILCDPKAKAIIEAINLRLRERMFSEVEAGLLAIAHEGIKQVAKTVTAEFDLGSRAKMHQDKVSLEAVKMVRGDPIDGIKDRVPSLDPSLAKRLVDALEKSNEAEQIRTGPVIEAEVVIETSSNGDSNNAS